MNYSFFDEVVVWNNKYAKENEGLKIIDLNEFYGIKYEEIKKGYNKLAKIFGIEPGANFEFVGKSIVVTGKDFKVTINKNYTIWEKDNIVIEFNNNSNDINFRIINNNGLYIYTHGIYGGKLLFYDQEALQYAKEHNSNTDEFIDYKTFFDQSGINSDKSESVFVETKNFSSIQSRAFTMTEVIRLFELLKNNKSPYMTIEAEKKGIGIDEVRRKDNNNDDGFLNIDGEFKTNAYWMKDVEKDEVEEFVTIINMKHYNNTNVILRIYSIKNVGSIIMLDLNTELATVATDEDRKNLITAYKGLITSALKSDPEASQKLYFSSSEYEDSRSQIEQDYKNNKNLVFFSKSTLQDGSILKNLFEFLPEGTIELLSQEEEYESTIAFKCEKEEIKRHNEARSLLQEGLEEALLEFKKHVNSEETSKETDDVQLKM